MNFRTLDLNLLRVFDAVMAERNVTRAAQRLAMTQPAVSNALRRLRDAVGDELFIPGPSGVAPTPLAETLATHVRPALDELRAAFDPRAGYDPAEDPRTFALAMADATATVLAPGLVNALPPAGAAALRLLPLASRDPRPLLEQGLGDAAIGFFPEVAAALATEGDGSPFALDDLYRCRYVAVLRRGHALADPDVRFDLAAYLGAHHVRVNFAGRPRGFVDEALARLGERRHVLLTVDHFATAARVVHDSDLVTVLPASYVAASGLAEGLVTRPMPIELPAIQVAMVWHRRHARDAGHRWMRGWVAEVARAVVASGIASPAPASLAAHAAQAAYVAEPAHVAEPATISHVAPHEAPSAANDRTPALG